MAFKNWNFECNITYTFAVKAAQYTLWQNLGMVMKCKRISSNIQKVLQVESGQSSSRPIINEKKVDP